MGSLSSLAGKNVVAGLLLPATFMRYGFVLIYPSDFALGKEQWIADYAGGKRFESPLAQVFPVPISKPSGRWISWLGLAGFWMPLAISWA